MLFAHLLASLLFALLALPLLDAAGYGLIGFIVQVAWMLLAGAFIASSVPRLRAPTFAFAATTLAANLFAIFDGGFAALLVARGLSAGFILFLTGLLLSHLIRAQEVSTDTILGGVSVYLLLGILFYTFYSLAQITNPGAFVSGGDVLTDRSGSGRYTSLIYFSFVTLTTLGYGDITPAIPLTRALAAIEAVLGQLYVAILIARLIGLYLVQGRDATR